MLSEKLCICLFCDQLVPLLETCGATSRAHQCQQKRAVEQKFNAELAIYDLDVDIETGELVTIPRIAGRKLPT